MATITGSMELISETGENLGLPVTGVDPALVPTLAAVLFGVTNVVAVTPPDFGAPNVPADIVGQWSATTADLHSATLLLHQETAFDLTALGRWLAAGQQGSV